VDEALTPDPYVRASRIWAVTLFAAALGYNVAVLALVYDVGHWPRQIIAYALGFFVRDYAVLLGAGALLAGVTARWPRARWLGLLAIPFVVLTRLTQLGTLYFTGGFLTQEAFTHIGMIGIFVNAPMVAITVAGAALIIAWAALLARRTARLEPAAGPKLLARLRAAAVAHALPMLLVLFSFATLSERSSLLPDQIGIVRRSPEAMMLATFRDLAGDSGSESVALSDADRARLHDFGIDVGTGDHPFRRDHAAHGAAPPLRPGAVPPKNVIVILFESLSARLLGPYNPRFAAETPTFARLAERSMMATSWYGHTTPTILALRGQLCSYYPVTGWEEWLDPQRLGGTALSCLPRILAERGFDTVYLSHADPASTALAVQMPTLGFEEQLYRWEMLELLRERTGTTYDLTDHEMLRGLRAWLERRQSDAPLFLVLSTMDLHMPFDPPPEAPPGDDPVRRILASTDHALGELLDWLDTSRYAHDTMLVVSADHAVYPASRVRPLLQQDPDYRPAYFDRLAFFLSSPSHQLPPRYEQLASSVDLAPTLLHLLGIDVPNAFMGHSIWDGPPHPLGVFGSTRHLGFVARADTREQIDVLNATDCDDDSDACLLVRWHAYVRQMSRAGRIAPALTR
jgi:hypothetical protein